MKIIKPVLLSRNEQERRRLKKGDWYWTGGMTYEMYKNDSPSAAEYPIYYEDEWPKQNEKYFYFDFINNEVDSTSYDPSNESDNLLMIFGNCFPTEEEAGDLDNIDQVLTTMREYYKKKSDAIRAFKHNPLQTVIINSGDFYGGPQPPQVILSDEKS